MGSRFCELLSLGFLWLFISFCDSFNYCVFLSFAVVMECGCVCVVFLRDWGKEFSFVLGDIGF